jgi:hypothetical protein
VGSNNLIFLNDILQSKILAVVAYSFNIVRVIKSRKIRWAGHVARMGEKIGMYRFLVGIPEGKRPLGRPRRKWDYSIKMGLQEVGCGSMECM